jgi:Tol biopolymer transport system component
MKLDDLARDAAEELRVSSVPDLANSFDLLRRTRTRRNALTATLVLVVFLLVGGLAFVRADHRAQGPSRPVGPGTVSNGAIVSGGLRGVSLLRGHLATLPDDARRYSSVQFTADGSELVYGRRSGGLVAMNVTTGTTRFLTACHGYSCQFAQLSPDGTRVAVPKTVGARSGIELRSVNSDRTVFVPTHGTGAAWPRWSPDGTSLVFSGPDGLYLMSVNGGPVRLLHGHAPGGEARPASWSPDGSTIAFLQPHVVTYNHGGTSWTLMTVKPDGSGLHSLRKVGRCYCVGIAPPTVAWSPDGRQILVTPIDSRRSVTNVRGGGLYSIRPDGTGWTPLVSTSGDVLYLAWQPLIQR